MQRIRVLQCQLHTQLPVWILSHYRCPGASETYYQEIPLVSYKPPLTDPRPNTLLRVYSTRLYYRPLSLLCSPEVKASTFPWRRMSKALRFERTSSCSPFHLDAFKQASEKPLKETLLPLCLFPTGSHIPEGQHPETLSDLLAPIQGELEGLGSRFLPSSAALDVLCKRNRTREEHAYKAHRSVITAGMARLIWSRPPTKYDRHINPTTYTHTNAHSHTPAHIEAMFSCLSPTSPRRTEWKGGGWGWREVRGAAAAAHLLW